VQTGDKITAANADKVKDMVSPAMYWLVQHGWPMVIADTQKINLRRAFTEATEKYSSQVKMSADGLKLEGYVAGGGHLVTTPGPPESVWLKKWTPTSTTPAYSVPARSLMPAKQVKPNCRGRRPRFSLES